MEGGGKGRGGEGSGKKGGREGNFICRTNMKLLPTCLLSIVFECFLLLGPLFVFVSLCLSVFCLLVVLVMLSVLAKWLVRKTPLRKLTCGKEIISTKPMPKSTYDFSGSVYCFFVLLCVFRALMLQSCAGHKPCTNNSVISSLQSTTCYPRPTLQKYQSFTTYGLH